MRILETIRYDHSLLRLFFPSTGKSYPIQVQIYRAIGVNGSCFPAKGDYFAKDADDLVGE